MRQRNTQFKPALAVELYKLGMGLTDIAVSFGYVRGNGQTRVRRALQAAGVYDATRDRKPAVTSAPAQTQADVKAEALAIFKAAGKTPVAATTEAAAPAAAVNNTQHENAATTPANYPDVLAQECYNMVASRYKMLRGRARAGWLEKLVGMLVAGMGETKTQKVTPVQLPEGLKLIKKAA